MDTSWLQIEKILETEIEYARSLWGRNLHVTELELVLQLVRKLRGQSTYVKESVR